jgi:hypothetical protein
VLFVISCGKNSGSLHHEDHMSILLEFPGFFRGKILWLWPELQWAVLPDGGTPGGRSESLIT